MSKFFKEDCYSSSSEECVETAEKEQKSEFERIREQIENALNVKDVKGLQLHLDRLIKLVDKRYMRENDDSEGFNHLLMALTKHAPAAKSIKNRIQRLAERNEVPSARKERSSEKSISKDKSLSSERASKESSSSRSIERRTSICSLTEDNGSDLSARISQLVTSGKDVEKTLQRMYAEEKDKKAVLTALLAHIASQEEIDYPEYIRLINNYCELSSDRFVLLQIRSVLDRLFDRELSLYYVDYVEAWRLHEIQMLLCDLILYILEHFTFDKDTTRCFNLLVSRTRPELNKGVSVEERLYLLLSDSSLSNFDSEFVECGGAESKLHDHILVRRMIYLYEQQRYDDALTTGNQLRERTELVQTLTAICQVRLGMYDCVDPSYSSLVVEAVRGRDVERHISSYNTAFLKFNL